MGDRANIVTQTQGRNSKPERVYLYGHWSGSTIHTTLQAALKRRARWNDHSYLTRIIFDQMTDGSHGEETGFGISASITDNEYPLLVVDVDAQRVIVEDEDSGKELAGFTLKDFTDLKLPVRYHEWLVSIGATQA